jgi:hypothetical protein
MLDFHLDVADIQLALASAEVIEEYDDDAQLVLGRSGTQALHVVIVRSNVISLVITVYLPDPTRWDAGFRRRIRS